MKTQFYRYTDDTIVYGGTATISVKETKASFIVKLIDLDFKYPPAALECLFKYDKKVIIRKDRSPHFTELGEDYFLIYPFRLGMPFLFRLETL